MEMNYLYNQKRFATHPFLRNLFLPGVGRSFTGIQKIYQKFQGLLDFELKYQPFFDRQLNVKYSIENAQDKMSQLFWPKIQRLPFIPGFWIKVRSIEITKFFYRELCLFDDIPLQI